MLIPFVLIAIALSVSLAEPLQKIENGIQEFSNKLISFLVSPIFIIFIIILCSIGLVFLVVSKYNSNREYRKKLIQEKMIVKKSTKSKAKKIHPKLAEIYLEPGGEDEVEVDFEDEEPYVKEELEEVEENTFEDHYGSYSRSVNIRVDEHKRYFHKKNISKDEVDYLLRKNYQIKKYKNLLSGRMENFLLLPRFNESFTHLFLTYNISEFLENNGIETEMFVTKKPDLVFKIKNKTYAIEIETGSIFSKIERMKEKLEVLENYDEWFFVVTDRNKVKKYKKYGDAVDKRYVKQRLDKLVKTAKNAQ